MPTVVNIATERVIEYHEWYDDLLRQFYGWSRAPVRQEKSISLGSGVMIDEEGYILTNFHVVRRASRVQIKLWDKREFEADPIFHREATDIALLKLRCKSGERFRAIKFAPDDDLLLGETVLALGNPFGLGGSVTKGILSSKNRRPSTENEPLNVEDWLQTDAAINPGNSGGPLVNLRGELIGINVAVYRDQGNGERGMGVGFSIPVKQISAALSRFFTPETTDSLWFGAQLKAESGSLSVASVRSGSPAAKGGLQAGDQLLEVNGNPAQSLMSYNRLLGAATNQPAILLVKRDGERQTLKVKLMPIEDLIRQKLGLTLLEAPPQQARGLGIQPGQGLFIEEVEKGSPAARAELQRGFFLAAIDGQMASDLRVLTEVLAAKEQGDKVRLGVVVPRRLGASFIEFQQGTVEIEVR
jgi:S1-C subfamily serine protease